MGSGASGSLFCSLYNLCNDATCIVGFTLIGLISLGGSGGGVKSISLPSSICCNNLRYSALAISFTNSSALCLSASVGISICSLISLCKDANVFVRCAIVSLCLPSSVIPNFLSLSLPNGVLISAPNLKGYILPLGAISGGVSNIKSVLYLISSGGSVPYISFIRLISSSYASRCSILKSVCR